MKLIVSDKLSIITVKPNRTQNNIWFKIKLRKPKFLSAVDDEETKNPQRYSIDKRVILH